MSDPKPDDLEHRVAMFDERVKRARAASPRTFWGDLAYVGGLGWLIALPIAAGAIGGHALDDLLGTGISLTLGGLMLGTALGGYFVWRILAPKEPES